MIYSIEFSRLAEKQLGDIPHLELKKIARRIDKLALEPFPHGHEKLYTNYLKNRLFGGIESCRQID